MRKGLLLLFILGFQITNAQAKISEETILLPTYGYSEPDPVPILVDNPKIFPYFKFYGYEQEPQKKPWKVVTIENDYIKVFILPEVGGKIWGAIEKSTGEEFLYKNEVMKFRNIAMRGPWVSGGVEFNFGIIGHSPDTASPIDFLTRENSDGSVSCIVGSMDLNSRTNWSVEIRLDPDKAYVETKTFWYNGTPLNQSYYNWMTAAAATADDLEFIYPGNQYLEHSGQVQPWPVDSLGRNTALYKNNNFGGAKSKHIVGEYKDFFGGYYHDRKFGFGHWAPYEEMPGQKLWLWSLSRFGGIWEDLLTDTDGQYMEFQAGRLFNQYFPEATNPVSQANFDPYVMDRWRELWFPYKEIGGMVSASEHGVLNVEDRNGSVYIAINALQNLNSEIEVAIDGKKVHTERLDLRPMEIFSRTFPGNVSQTTIYVKDTELHFTGDVEADRIKRPFEHDSDIKLSKTEQQYTDGWEYMKFREFKKAHEKLTELLAVDPYHQDGLIKMAELEFRKAQFEKALQHANTALKIDTYNPGANYLAGIAYRAMGDDINALESLGWAARDIGYRTAAYTEMAEIYVASKNVDRAKMYSEKAIDFNTYNLHARYVKALAAKEKGEQEVFSQELEKILEIDPLNHFAHLEKAYADSPEAVQKMIAAIDNEFPEETVLELALLYHSLGFSDSASGILALRSETPKNKLWLAYLLRDNDVSKSTLLLGEVLGAPAEFVFPYRLETLPVLEWATKKVDHWKLDYYLAQNYLAVGQENKGKDLLRALGDTPDSDVFYRFRAQLLNEDSYAQRKRDYKKALKLNPSDWKVWEEHIQFYLQNKKYDDAYSLSKRAYRKFQDNYSIGLSHAKALVNNEHYDETLKVLEKVQILPYEHAKESRDIYERAHMVLALQNYKKEHYEMAVEVLKKSKEWPENIGVGKPYDPDEREQDFLLALTFEQLGKPDEAKLLLQGIVQYTQQQHRKNSLNDLYGLLAAKKLKGDSAGLRNVLEQSIGENHLRGQAALAIFSQDKVKMENLRSKIGIPQDLWAIAEWAVRNQ